MRYKLLCAVHVFLIRNGQVLLLRRFQTGYEDGNYSVPAGHLEENETVRQAAARELKEEAGLSIEPVDLKVVHTMHRRSDQDRVDFFVVAETWQGEVHNMEPQKCDELRWCALSDLPPNTIPYIRSALDSLSKTITFSEFGWSATKI